MLERNGYYENYYSKEFKFCLIYWHVGRMNEN